MVEARPDDAVEHDLPPVGGPAWVKVGNLIARQLGLSGPIGGHHEDPAAAHERDPRPASIGSSGARLERGTLWCRRLVALAGLLNHQEQEKSDGNYATHGDPQWVDRGVAASPWAPRHLPVQSVQVCPARQAHLMRAARLRLGAIRMPLAASPLCGAIVTFGAPRFDSAVATLPVLLLRCRIVGSEIVRRWEMPRFTTLTLSVVAFSACSQEPLTPPRPVADRQAPASYEMLDLGDLSAFGDGDRIVKLSDRGEIAGSRLSFTTFAYRSFFWDAGGLRDLG